MGLIRRYLTGFRGVDTDAPGLFEKDDGTSWYRKPDGSEVEIGGSQPSLQWAAWESAPFVDPIISEHQTTIPFQPAFFGAGGIDGLTLTDTGDGPNTDFVFSNVGQYLVALNFVATAGISNLVDPGQFLVEVQVFNGEYDPWLIVPVYRPEDPYALASFSDVIGIYAGDTPVLERGFTIQCRPRSLDFQPQQGFIGLKVVQLSTT